MREKTLILGQKKLTYKQKSYLKIEIALQNNKRLATNRILHP